MATKKYLDYAGLKRVLAKLLPGARKIWHGTQAEWDALSAAERDKYDQAEIIDSTAEIYHIKPDWASAISLTGDQITAGYTVPSDGLFVGYWIRNPSSLAAAVHITVNNVCVGISDDPNEHAPVCVPVSKGDIIKADNAISSALSFVPWAN